MTENFTVESNFDNVFKCEWWTRIDIALMKEQSNRDAGSGVDDVGSLAVHLRTGGEDRRIAVQALWIFFIALGHKKLAIDDIANLWREVEEGDRCLVVLLAQHGEQFLPAHV